MQLSKSMKNPFAMKNEMNNDKIAEAIIESNSVQAEKMLNNKGKLEEFLNGLENKLKLIPGIGDQLSDAATLASMIKDYASGDYPNMPVGTAVAALASLIYIVSPIDLISDVIPVAGQIDDLLVLSVCKKLIESDLDDYKEWRTSEKESIALA